MSDLISREALKKHKFLTPQLKVVGGRRCGKTREQIIEAYQKGWNACIDAIIDNAPTVEINTNDIEYKAYCKGLEDGKKIARLQGKWIIIGEEQGALGIIYRKRKCSKCGWEHSSVIPNNYCPNCGVDMRKGGVE